MRTPEGRKDLFQVRYSYWPQEALDRSMVIYDFACSADEYLLNREPILFQKTRLFMDKFHARNHSCSGIYHLKNYPALRNFNSSCSEQHNRYSTFVFNLWNRFTQRFASQLAFMKQETAIIFLKAVYSMKNQLQNENVGKMMDK